MIPIFAVTIGWIAVGAGVVVGPVASRYVSQRRLARRCSDRRTLVLTYDDGPGAGATPRLLDVVAAHGARVSFFALGSRAEAAPDVLDRAVREGHEIGTHSYSHLHPWRSLPWQSLADVKRGMSALARWTEPSPLFRPPHGKVTPMTWWMAKSRGFRFAWWTIDSGDTWDVPPDAGRIVEAVRRARGGVVLMHDFDRADARVDYILDLTERLLRAAREDGLRVMPLGELLRESRRAAAL
jgi:peptidoglycan/xylan/chitin deacetylase (PgdA/CDA1 family)